MNATKQQLIDIINKYWSFDNNQVHTHTWHDKQDCIREISELLFTHSDTDVSDKPMNKQQFIDFIKEYHAYMWPVSDNEITEFVDRFISTHPSAGEVVTDTEIEKWAIGDISTIFNIRDMGPVVDIAYNARVKGAKWMRSRLTEPTK